MEDLLSDFLAETLESLGQLDTALVRLERNPDDKATLSSIFRHVHTIKGTCGFLGLARLERVSHAAESVLDRHRDGALAATPVSITLILRTLDRMRLIVEGLRAAGEEPAGDDAGLIAELNALAEFSPPAADEADEAAVVELAAVELAAVELAAVELAIVELAIVERPAAERAPTEPAIAGSSAAEPAREEIGSEKSAAKTIRVGVDVLEGLMTLVSELVLTRNQILQIARTRAEDAFAGPLQRLSRITSDLQEGVMKTRMQPIGYAWSTLPRLVRDLATELGKKIELVMLGAETELDRQVLELIKDPLTHMLRNSADHGLENAADRRAAGKPERGRIKLNAFHEGGHIVIEVGDDGRGLPVERIRAKILANGLASEAELAAMPDQQIQAFIFNPGFSTAAAITSVSGRGVGMDVVKTNIERIGGAIALTSSAGAGTLFTIKIPLTLAIVSALIVEVRGERFAVPQTGVIELARVPVKAPRLASDPEDGEPSAGAAVERIGDTPVLRLREHLLPLIDLGDLLKLAPARESRVGESEAASVAEAGESLHIVVAQAGESRFGLIVDRVFDTEEIVVKPMAPILRHIPVFGGNTILGDGSVIMILDPSGIARATGIGAKSARAAAPPSEAAEAEHSGRRIALLLFKAGDAQIKGAPLSLISRIESVERTAIEESNGQPLTQYRGKLIPLLSLTARPHGACESAAARMQPILVFADGDRAMGLMVDEIVDVVEAHLRIELPSDREGFLGTAIVQGQATDILDASFWLKRAFRDWFASPPSEGRRILVVEDSPFFRGLIVTALAAEGHHVTAVENPLRALALRDAGRSFDLILSDIEMPEMDGLAFARKIRDGGPWADLPLVALTSLSSPPAAARGRDAGFDAYISKFDKETLLEAVRSALAPEAPHASRPGRNEKSRRREPAEQGAEP